MRSVRSRVELFGLLLLLWSAGGAAGTVSYQYDALHRLTRVTYADGTLIQYNYDPAGNRLARFVDSDYEAAPAAPVGLSATDNAYLDRVVLGWSAVSGVSYYEVYRNGALIASVTGASYGDTSASPGTVYSYQAKACSAGGCSGLSAPDNGSRPDAALLTLGAACAGDIGSAGEQHHFRFDVNQRGRVTLSTTGSTNTYGELFDGSGQLLAGDDNGAGGGNFQISYAVSPGTYYVRVGGGTPATTGAYTLVSTFAAARVHGDFNRDLMADLLWRNMTTGQNALWFMNGATLADSAFLLNVPGDWQVLALGDFNADGQSDLLWHHTSGANAIWLLDGTTLLDSAYTYPTPPEWQVTGTGDSDGDGRDDLLWRNAATGQNALWRMSGLTLAGADNLINVPGDWQVTANGDFDGDGHADLLWHHTGGTNALWLMNGATIRDSALTHPTPPAWQVAGSGDFDGDGNDDLLWRNGVTGENAIWFMAGTSVLGGPMTLPIPNLAWKVATVGDFDGDGKADIVWRNHSTGENALWLMDGATVLAGPFLYTVPDMSWEVQR